MKRIAFLFLAALLTVTSTPHAADAGWRKPAVMLGLGLALRSPIVRKQAVAFTLRGGARLIESQAVRQGAGRIATNQVGAIVRQIRTVNPKYGLKPYSENCFNCVVTSSNRLNGLHVSAAPSKAPVSLLEVEAEMGAKFSSFLNASGLRKKMLEYGGGAEGVVYGKRLGDSIGHYMHAVNQNGIIHVLDPQLGRIANLGEYAFLKLLRMK